MIFEIYIWAISFISLYVSVFWIVISTHSIKSKLPKLEEFPFVSIVVPVWNEERTVIQTLESLSSLDYDKNKLEIIVVNDGSTDGTEKVVKDFLNNNDFKHIKLISQKNKGKAGALNTGLKEAKGEIVGVVDADSFINPQALKLMLPYFFEKDVAAVISPIKVAEPKNIIEKIQRIEYIFSSFGRKLMSKVGTLHITHGVLSLFKKEIIEKLGGFDEKNLTEDYEIAMRLRQHGYKIILCEENINYTKVPNKLKGLWFQRVRWFRGFMFNGLKYKNMIMNKRYGLLGRFQIPIEILTLFIVLFSFGFIGYQISISVYQFILKVNDLGLEIFNFTLPTLKEFILTLDFKIIFPVAVTLIAGLYLYNMAHRYVEEKWKFHLVSFIYLFLYPFIKTLQWVHAFFLELFGAKEKWR